MRNRVSPDGSLIEAPSGSRGLLMGNRGVLQPRHYELRKPFAIKPWIACILKDKTGAPLPKADIKYTRLFLLDEITAFAAGHRPCGQCQRRRFQEFVQFWCKANQKEPSRLDEFLHQERLAQLEPDGLVHSALSKLPSGTMVKFGRSGQSHLWLWKKLFPWAVSGYQTPIDVREETVVEVLTPPSIVKAFKAGFPLALNADLTVHPSIAKCLSGSN